jgi:glycine cleavage system H protein
VASDYQIPDELAYTREDEWAKREGGRLRCGITDYAQQQLGDIVFVELPAIGTQLSAGKTFGVIESVKAVSDLFAPATGRVVEINERLAAQPELVNQDCYGEGWMLAIELEGPAPALLDARSYAAHVKERSQA